MHFLDPRYRVLLTPAFAVGVVALMFLSGSMPANAPQSTAVASRPIHLVASPLAPVANPAPPASPPPPTITNPLNYTWAGSVIPTEREDSALTFDPADRCDLLFGGLNGTTYLGDTWEYSANQWIQLYPSVAPSPRAGAALSYDARDGTVVLFGGFNRSGPLGDTWDFLNGTWTELNTPTAPTSRGFASLTYDSTVGDGYLVLFGGRNNYGTLSDTWTFEQGQWTHLPATSPSPSGRSEAGMAYDGHDGCVLLFGGMNQTALAHTPIPTPGKVTYLNDTWKFVGGTWSAVPTGTAPAPRSNFAFVYSANGTTGSVLLFGGTNLSKPVDFSDTWSFSDGVWTQLHLTSGPSPRAGAESAWDGIDGYTLVAEGSSDGSVGITDAWEFVGGMWRIVSQIPQFFWPQPAARSFASMADGVARGVDIDLLFGGLTAMGANSETWTFAKTSIGLEWVELFPTTTPSARAYSTLVYDVADGYFLLFGGRNSTGGVLGDTWEFNTTALTWAELSPSLSPAPRYGASMTYDAAVHEVILFGGTTGSGAFLSDTWTFEGGVWTELSLSPAPSARAFSGFTYDTKEGFALLYGGLNSAVLGDSWTFSGGVWTELALTLSPPPLWDPGLQYEPNVFTDYIHNGCTVYTATPTSGSCVGPWAGTLKFYADKWHTFTSTSRGGILNPTPSFGQASAYDPLEGGSVIYFSGYNATGLWLDRWNIVGSGWSQWTPVEVPTPRVGMSSVYAYGDVQHIMFFGGYGPFTLGGVGYHSDTWEWDTGSWGQADPKFSPSPRAYAAMAETGGIYNHSTSVVTVLFGGFGPTGYLNDTWTWTGGVSTGEWTQVATPRAPSPRANASMVYDNATNQIILFGGQNAEGALGDTWALNVLTMTWTQLQPNGSPSPRAAAGMTYDYLDQYLVLFGGYNNGTGNASKRVYNDTWTFSSNTWTQLATTGAPSPRYGLGMEWTFQIARTYNFVLLFGGETASGTYLGDTWQFLHGVWTPVLVGKRGEPLPAAFMTFSQDWNNGNPIIFGGFDGSIMDDFWVYR